MTPKITIPDNLKEVKGCVLAERKIKLLPKYGEDLNVGGLYAIWFKNKFYIGRAKNISKRINQHRQQINLRLKRRSEFLGYWKITGLIEKDRRLVNGWVQVILICDEKTAIKLEEMVLLYNAFNHNCLNLTFGHQTQIENIKPFRYYYKKSYNHEFRY